ncbi:MAG: transposase [Gemmataceae bacterium]|nr:transposase [Gemmataceae bacterium]
MSTHTQRSSGKEQFWRTMIRRWRQSGLAVRAFCREHGLSEPSFFAWRRTLAERDAERDTARDASTVRFVPVRVTPESTVPTAAHGSSGALELVLGAGRRLRIGPGFDEPTLRRLLALLENGHDQSQTVGQAEGRP